MKGTVALKFIFHDAQQEYGNLGERSSYLPGLSCSFASIVLSKRVSGPFAQCASHRYLSASELPRVLHHQFEVVVAVDRAAHSLVVLAELFESDDTVGFLGVPLRHELLEDLIERLFALIDLWVLAGIVDLCDVGQRYLTVLIHIQFVIGGPNCGI